MGKRAKLPPSAFWRRLATALEKKGIPSNANAVSQRLRLSQGSTHRWYLGTGMPELDNLLQLSKMGGVTVDWLINESLPREPVRAGSDLHRLLEIWDKLGPEGRKHILAAAEGELAKLELEKQLQERSLPFVPSPHEFGLSKKPQG